MSTPDHWHCLMAMMACAAGKDVYVEKPLSVFVKEGRWLARSPRSISASCKSAHSSGADGTTTQVRGFDPEGAHRQGCMQPFGRLSERLCPVSAPPPMPPRRATSITICGSGPHPRRPYNQHRGIYHFRWFWDYSGGQMTNLGAHSIDIVQWYLDLKGPQRVCSFGGRRALEDNGETPDVQDAIFEYPMA